jgi:hypothetical protein
MVCQGDEEIGSQPSGSAQGLPELAATTTHEAPTKEQTDVSGMQIIRQAYELEGISPQVTEFLIKSWRDGTQRQYQTYIRKWLQYCSRQQCSAFSPSVNTVLEFLLEMFHTGKDGDGLSYSTINTVRSALSTIIRIDNKPIGQHALVTRFLKAAFNERPALPKTGNRLQEHQQNKYAECDCMYNWFHF